MIFTLKRRRIIGALFGELRLRPISARGVGPHPHSSDQTPDSRKRHRLEPTDHDALLLELSNPSVHLDSQVAIEAFKTRTSDNTSDCFLLR